MCLERDPGRVPSTGASAPVGLGQIPFLVRACAAHLGTLQTPGLWDSNGGIIT